MRRLIKSFRFAFEGIFSAVQTETNWKIGIVEAILTFAAGLYFKIAKTDWLIIIIMVGIVLSAELFNSAIETIVDSFTHDTHPGAKLAKDFAAGAVVMTIIAAAVVGLIVFLPYFSSWLIRTGI